tara:strand:- start:2600 stop:3004 length:405 start_codon:yes stop_codon:yes gene_type:complete
MVDSEVQALREKLKFRETISARHKKSSDDLKRELNTSNAMCRSLAKTITRLEGLLETKKKESTKKTKTILSQSAEIKRMTNSIYDLKMSIESGEVIVEVVKEEVKVEAEVKPTKTTYSAAYWKKMYFSELKRVK